MRMQSSIGILPVGFRGTGRFLEILQAGCLCYSRARTRRLTPARNAVAILACSGLIPRLD
jgi:hypothetical protein